MTEFEALELVAAHDGESYAAILAAARAAGFPDDLQNRMRFDKLREDEYIIGDGLTCLRLTPDGLDRIQQYKKEAHKEKEERRQKVWNNIIAVLGILPLTETAAFRTVVNLARLIPPAISAALRNWVKNWVK